MPKTSVRNIKHFIKMKESLSNEGKKKLLHALKLFKECEISPQEPMWVSEYDGGQPERNVVAKTFDTQADFDSYTNQRRGIEMTPKEQQAVLGYKKAKPTKQDKFFIQFETTDTFGNNTTTTVKKLKEGPQFCWTAFSKHETAEDEGKPAEEPAGDISKESPPEDMGKGSEPPLKEAVPPTAQNVPSEDEVTVDDPIRITKTITFNNDTEGANILGDFLRKLDI